MSNMSEGHFGLQAMLESSSVPVRRALLSLGAAESLTDWVAVELASKAGLSAEQSVRLVKGLHFADFVVERNSEWHFAAAARSFLSASLQRDPGFWRRSHSLLAGLAASAQSSDAYEKLPVYLVNGVGKAFHTAAVSPEDGLHYYACLALGGRSGAQWLLGCLAVEQQTRGILPASAIEPPFIRAITR